MRFHVEYFDNSHSNVTRIYDKIFLDAYKRLVSSLGSDIR